MRDFVYFLLLAAPAFGQAVSQTETYTFDASGRRVLDSRQVSRNGTTEQSVANLNGRSAPIEKVEERVVRQDSTGRVVERIIRPFDANGNPLPPQKIRITEKKGADGSKATDTEVFQGNLNGGYSLAERRQALERTAGDRTTVETQIARPTINGSLDTVEKKSATIVKTGEKTQEDVLTYRRDTSGGFYAAAREVKESGKKEGRVVETSATYISGERRQLELAGQTVAETVKQADGSETKQVSIYGMSAPGRPAEGRAVLREQQIIEKNKTANGLVERLSIRRPAVDNPKALGPVQRISEKVCTGPCQ